MQTLYELDCTSHSSEDIVARWLDEEGFNESSELFFRLLVDGVTTYQAQLDRIIQDYAPEWPVDQIAIIDRNILRIAIFELLVGEQTPLKVAINEAVELAKMYGSDSAPRFVNGVLGTLVERKSELQQLFRNDTDPTIV